MAVTESNSIRQLQQNKSFVIKEADKADPTITFKKKLDQLLKRAFEMRIITKRELQFLEGSRQDCEHFIGHLNENPLNIFLTHKISESEVDFLDLRIKLQDSRFVTSLFRKSTATNNLLHFASFHPTHLKKDGKLATHIDDRPRIIARRAPNLKDTLVRSHFQRPVNTTGRGGIAKGFMWARLCRSSGRGYSNTPQISGWQTGTELKGKNP